MPSLKPVERGLSYLARRGMKDGVVGGSNVWVALGVVAFLVRWIRRSNGPRTVYSAELRPGERIVIAHGASSALKVTSERVAASSTSASVPG